MTSFERRTLAKLQPGDAIFAKKRTTRRGRSRSYFEPIGVVESVEKNVPGRYVTVRFTDGSGYSQNWAAAVYLKIERS